eukprot:2071100-Pleurochrysis_carterae.AAC.1
MPWLLHGAKKPGAWHEGLHYSAHAVNWQACKNSFPEMPRLVRSIVSLGTKALVVPMVAQLALQQAVGRP